MRYLAGGTASVVAASSTHPPAPAAALPACPRPRPHHLMPSTAPPAGRDLGSVLRLRGGAGQRVFGWQRHGCRVAYEVSKALNYLHSRGIVHMVRREGGGSAGGSPAGGWELLTAGALSLAERCARLVHGAAWRRRRHRPLRLHTAPLSRPRPSSGHQVHQRAAHQPRPGPALRRGPGPRAGGEERSRFGFRRRARRAAATAACHRRLTCCAAPRCLPTRRRAQ